MTSEEILAQLRRYQAEAGRLSAECDVKWRNGGTPKVRQAWKGAREAWGWLLDQCDAFIRGAQQLAMPLQTVKKSDSPPPIVDPQSVDPGSLALMLARQSLTAQDTVDTWLLAPISLSRYWAV